MRKSGDIRVCLGWYAYFLCGKKFVANVVYCLAMTCGKVLVIN